MLDAMRCGFSVNSVFAVFLFFFSVGTCAPTPRSRGRAAAVFLAPRATSRVFAYLIYSGSSNFSFGQRGMLAWLIEGWFRVEVCTRPRVAVVLRVRGSARGMGNTPTTSMSPQVVLDVVPRKRSTHR